MDNQKASWLIVIATQTWSYILIKKWEYSLPTTNKKWERAPKKKKKRKSIDATNFEKL